MHLEGITEARQSTSENGEKRLFYWKPDLDHSSTASSKEYQRTVIRQKGDGRWSAEKTPAESAKDLQENRRKLEWSQKGLLHPSLNGSLFIHKARGTGWRHDMTYIVYISGKNRTRRGDGSRSIF